MPFILSPLPLTSSCWQDLPFHSPVYSRSSTLADSYVMEDNELGAAGGE